MDSFVVTNLRVTALVCRAVLTTSSSFIGQLLAHFSIKWSIYIKNALLTSHRFISAGYKTMS